MVVVDVADATVRLAAQHDVTLAERPFLHDEPSQHAAAFAEKRFEADAVCGAVGILADVAAVSLPFWAPWAPIFTKSGWALAVGLITVASIAIGLAIYFISERGRREPVGPQAAAAQTGLS